MHEPRIRAMKTHGALHTAVFFSREDLTAGLVGQKVDGIIGYQPDVATQLMGNIIQHVTRTRRH